MRRTGRGRARRLETSGSLCPVHCALVHGRFRMSTRRAAMIVRSVSFVELADDFFEEVFEGHDPAVVPVRRGDDGELAAVLAHHPDRGRGRRRTGEADRRSSGLRAHGLGRRGRAEGIADVHHCRRCPRCCRRRRSAAITASRDRPSLDWSARSRGRALRGTVTISAGRGHHLGRPWCPAPPASRSAARVRPARACRARADDSSSMRSSSGPCAWASSSCGSHLDQPQAGVGQAVERDQRRPGHPGERPERQRQQQRRALRVADRPRLRRHLADHHVQEARPRPRRARTRRRTRAPSGRPDRVEGRLQQVRDGRLRPARRGPACTG